MDRRDTIRIKETDYVFVTLGSMTESSSLGSMTKAPELVVEKDDGSWAFWKRIASRSPHFGHPGVFADHVDQSKWVSFTTTLRDKILFDRIRDLTGNVPGEGGLITFAESSWLMSIVLPHQPHFKDQPEDVQVFWGYGLFVDKPGDYVNKPMSKCNGREIMTELLFHLGLLTEVEGIMNRSNCIPCMLPFITSQFLCRSKGDRPEVVPTRSRNLAFMGQFCELPDDVVFTVEYSVRSAQSAVYQLLKVDRMPPRVYQGKYDPRVLLRASLALHDARA
jgi:oleate hydratase